MFLSAENNENDVIVLDDDDSEIWDLSECIICSKKLTSKNEFKCSKLLQCLHAICQNCFNDWDGNTDKQCSICGFFSKKKDITENKVLAEMVSDDDNADTKDIVCTIHDAPVTHWCFDCAEFICQDCVNHHAQLKSTQNHVIKPQKEYLEAKSAVQRSVFPCSLHPENDLTIICHTCKTMTCRDCQLEAHKDHKYDFISDSITSAKTELFDFYKKVEYKSIILSSALKKISDRETKIELLKKSLVSDISKEFDLIQELLKKRCESLMITAIEKANKKLEDCENNKLLIQKNINLLEHCLKFVKFVLYSSSDAVLFYTKDYILNHLKRISIAQSIPNPMDLVLLKFSTANIEEFKKKIADCGAIDDKECPADISWIDKKYLHSVYSNLISVYKSTCNELKEKSTSADVHPTPPGAEITPPIPTVVPGSSYMANTQCSMEPTATETQKVAEPTQQQWHIPETMHISNKAVFPFNNINQIGKNIKRVKLLLHTENTPAITKPSGSNTPGSFPESVESFDEVMSTINEMENREKNQPQIAKAHDHTLAADFQNDSWCSVCLKGGEVVCCNNCPKVFHQKCHIPEILLPSTNYTFPIQSLNWRCLLCQDIPPLISNAHMTHNDKQLKELKIASRLLLELYCQVDASTPFRFSHVNQYDRSLCLSDIKNNLANGKYPDILLFVRDVRYMFAYCFHYEQKDYQKLAHARTLQEIFNRLLSQFVPQTK